MYEFIRTIAGQKVLIRTHERPDLDEICALFLAEQFADKRFLAQYCAGNVLELGVGDGPFNEHAGPGRERKNGHSCCSLIAAALGTRMSSDIGVLVQEITSEDLNGSRSAHHLARVIKVLYEQHPDATQKVIAWVLEALTAKLQVKDANPSLQLKQFRHCILKTKGAAAADAWMQFALQAIEARERWYKAAPKDMEDSDTFFTEGEEYTMTVGEEVYRATRAIRCCLLETDNPLIAGYALSKKGGGYKVIVVRRSNGQHQIFFAPCLAPYMPRIAALLNYYEQVASGAVHIRDFGVLSSEGNIKGGRWFYFSAKNPMLLNGSKKYLDVPPSGLSLNRILLLVRLGLSPRAFQDAGDMGVIPFIVTPA